MGLLITIEANDGSGKETQSKRLLQRLTDEGYKAKLISFPNYTSDASSLVKMYLKGDFGSSADDVSPYAASVFFAVDRFASYKTEWQDFYESGGVVIADRYTTANMVHQTTKLLGDAQQVNQFLAWLDDFEYHLMGIPRPDMTFFLDVSYEHSLSVVKGRANKIDGSNNRDIHERDESHLKRAYEAAHIVGKLQHWIHIPCMVSIDEGFKPIEVIHNDIYTHVLPLLQQKGILPNGETDN